VPPSKALAGRVAIGGETEILRMVAHQEEERKHDEQRTTLARISTIARQPA
jgi:hypothetical protein